MKEFSIRIKKNTKTTRPNLAVHDIQDNVVCDVIYKIKSDFVKGGIVRKFLSGILNKD